MTLSHDLTQPALERPPSQHLPRIVIFGALGITLRSAPSCPNFETTELDCHCFATDAFLEPVLIAIDPHVIITIGELASFPVLHAAPFEIRKRWIHFNSDADLDAIGVAAFNCFLSVCLDRRTEQPLVSIFTPTYRTGERFARTWRSVTAQSYANWEWIILDDSGDDGQTADMIATYAAMDHRIKLIRSATNSGVIGDVKYRACTAARGDLLAELDHDDMLLPDALAHLVRAARAHPEAGFFYTDFAEVDDKLTALRYGEGWGYGYGSYRTEHYEGKPLAVVVAPNINPKTIRGLVAAPNHLRVWRRDTYLSMGGHNRLLSVADDMDLMIRTFLVTRMVRIPKLCYLQFHDGTNTQSRRNKDIQRLVRFLRVRYDQRIHDRFLELGLEDWVWNETWKCSDLSVPNPRSEQSATILASLT